MGKMKSEKKITATCPRCHESWSEIKFDSEDMLVLPKNIKILKGKKKTEYKDGEDLECSCCGYKYTTWDMLLSVFHIVNAEELGEDNTEKAHEKEL